MQNLRKWCTDFANYKWRIFAIFGAEFWQSYLTRLSMCLSVCVSTCEFLCVCVSVCGYLSVHECVCLPACLSACLPVCLSVWLSVCVSDLWLFIADDWSLPYHRINLHVSVARQRLWRQIHQQQRCLATSIIIVIVIVIVIIIIIIISMIQSFIKEQLVTNFT